MTIAIMSLFSLRGKKTVTYPYIPQITGALLSYRQIIRT